MSKVSPNTHGLRVRDWASLNASLVWAYDCTYDVGGLDERTQPIALAVWLVRQGEVKVMTQAGDVQAGAGKWILPGRIIRRQMFSPDAQVLSVNFLATWPDGRWLLPGDKPAVFPAASYPRFTNESIRLAQYVTSHFGAKGVSLQSRTLLLTDFLDLERQFLDWLGLLVRTAEEAGLKVTAPVYADERVTDALRLLNRWASDCPFKEESLARSVGLSAIHLNRLFMRSVGLSPRAYFERCRMERAVGMLRDPDRRIKEVAADLGFSSPAYFSSWFQRLHHCSPVAYRHEHVDRSR
ncbi:MAG: AraC family transcriptional regulator [Chthoniobacteraceae bacterium]